MSDSWLIKGGTLVTPESGEIEADLRIENGRIAAAGRDLDSSGARVFDASGKYVFPGFIDPHVHLANFNQFDPDCETETISAAAGGVTTIGNFIKIMRHRPKPVSYHEVWDEIVTSMRLHPTPKRACGRSSSISATKETKRRSSAVRSASRTESSTPDFARSP